MREESPNGGVERQLAGGGLPWHGEKLRKVEEASAGRALLYPGGERERCVVPHVDDWTPALSHLTVLVSPIPRPLTGGPRSVF
jgi:hypothetical protein